VATAADDQMIVHRNAERLGGLYDVLGDRDVRFRRARITGRMIVDQNQGGRAQFERALEDLAGVDRRVIDGAALLTLVLDQYVFAVEEQDMELLDPPVRDLGGAVAISLSQELTTGRSCSCDRISRNAASRADLTAAIPASPRPAAASVSGSALNNSANPPNCSSRSLASGLTSARGLLAKRITSSNS
jgi:hypothetical protein